MKSENIITKIESIETQLGILKGIVGKKTAGKKPIKIGLVQMKGILKGRGKFSEEDIGNVLIQYGSF